VVQWVIMERSDTAEERPRPERVPSIDWLSTLRAYINEDWLTAGIAEYLNSQADAARATQPLPCLGCRRRFPRSDLWIHQRFADAAYCDACYYGRFGRRAG
jgi:hypothetical protein